MTRMSEREWRELTGEPTKRKYNNTVVDRDGMKFDSQRELDRWCELQLLERVGSIHDLRRQVPYDLIVNGIKVARYVADFVYTTAGQTVVEDVKGVRTDVFILKRKLMKAIFNIEVQEVK